MISDYWLLSDLDGTLISTPHKAQGQYLPLTRSPCYAPIRRWLLNGGNVCIVTTADQRVIDQVYQPLRECLAESEERCQEYLARLARSDSATPGKKTKRPMAGKLLLSLYTGAVLYLCTAKSVYLLPGYSKAMHCATREAVALTRAFNVELPTAPLYTDESSTTEHSLAAGKDEKAAALVACVRGTCINRTTSDWLQTRVKGLYTRYLKDILLGEPVVVEALQHMSTRYKRMWRAILTFLENMFLFHKQHSWAVKLPPMGNDFSILSSGAAQSAESKMWKAAYFSQCEGLLAALGILRVEYVEEEVFFSDGDNNCSVGVDSTATKKRRSRSQRSTEAAERRRKAAEADRKVVVDHAVTVLLSRASPKSPEAEVRPVVENFANYMTNLLGTDPRDLKKRLGHAPTTYDDVAQVILLGLPFSLYSRYFAKSVPDFVRGGVQAVPQPNSVVFSKTGVSKSTTLRYLLGKGRVVDDTAAAAADGDAGERKAGTARDLDTAFAACVAANRAISLGDNPHTTDYELTVFDDVVFLSVEKQSQRDERHHRIQRRLQRAKEVEDRGERPTLPDGSPAPSYAELVAAQKHSGPMMDERLLPNVMYVGGEEEGVAVLLSTLMDRLKVPPLASSGGHVGSGESGIGVAEFQRTLVAAQSSARRTVQASRFSKL